MGWREEVLLDQQFFGPPNGMSAAQKRIVEYATGVIGGTMFALNCVYYLKLELEKQMPEAAAKLGLSRRKVDLDVEQNTKEGTPRGDAGGGAF